MLILKKYIFRIVSMKNFEKDFCYTKMEAVYRKFSRKNLFREDFKSI